jgi:HEXXH motif-containing protein
VVVPPPHRLRFDHLDSLAEGRFDRDALAVLRSAERSRRLLLLREVLKVARARDDATGPLRPVSEAWAMLLRAYHAAPDLVEGMLADPQTGTWVAHVLRRLRGSSDDTAPLWFHVGQLHAFAVSAAIRTGVRGDMTIPVRRGDALLPTLGCLRRLPERTAWDHADVGVGNAVRIRCAGRTVEWDPRSADGVPDWFPSRSLKSVSDDLRLTVALDDLAPYRWLDNPIRPEPLDGMDAGWWQALLDDAWRLLVADHRDRARELAAGMTSLTPRPAAPWFRPHSTSVEDGFGGAILSMPFESAQFAVTLVHEFQHSVLNGLRHLAPLVQGADPPVGYAAWRDDPRPVEGLLHGIFAFTAVAEFWAVRRVRAPGLADFEFALWRCQTRKVLGAVRDSPVLTAAGRRLIAGIATRFRRLDSQAVPADTLAAAEAAAADHVASWRACHLRPDPAAVLLAADAWIAGRSAPAVWTASVTEPGRTAQRLDAKAVLTRILIAEPAGWEGLTGDAALPDGASAADVAYVIGDLATAHQRYLAELATASDRAAAWSGLGLVLVGEGSTPAGELLLERPELVRAVTEAVVARTKRPPPDELAAWLARGTA